MIQYTIPEGFEPIGENLYKREQVTLEIREDHVAFWHESGTAEFTKRDIEEYINPDEIVLLETKNTPEHYWEVRYEAAPGTWEQIVDDWEDNGPEFEAKFEVTIKGRLRPGTTLADLSDWYDEQFNRIMITSHDDRDLSESFWLHVQDQIFDAVIESVFSQEEWEAEQKRRDGEEEFFTEWCRKNPHPNPTGSRKEE